MSILKIEDRFELDAPADQAWAYLTRPQRIVGCLPGAELTEVTGEGEYTGSFKVKLGAVAMHFAGTVVFTDVDHERKILRIDGKAREKRGSGTAVLTMEARVDDLEGAGSAVTVLADIRLAGKIVRFGRGMIGAVTKEILRDFTACLADRLAADVPTGPEHSAEPEASPSSEGDVTSAKSRGRELRLLPVLLRSLGSWLRRPFGHE